MASVKDTVRQALFAYPDIYPNPKRVLAHLFCSIGNNYEWKKGELVSGSREPSVTQMQLEDLEPGYVSPIVARMWREHPEMEERAKTRQESPEVALKKSAQRLQRQFIADNIEAILDAPLTNSYFGNPWEVSDYMAGSANAQHSPGLNFPSDIKEDWAKTLEGFLRHWRQCLGQRFGCGTGLGDTTHWPQQPKLLMKEIEAAQARLHPLLHNGETLAEGQARARAALEAGAGAILGKSLAPKP